MRKTSPSQLQHKIPIPEKADEDVVVYEGEAKFEQNGSTNPVDLVVTLRFRNGADFRAELVSESFFEIELGSAWLHIPCGDTVVRTEWEVTSGWWPAPFLPPFHARLHASNQTYVIGTDDPKSVSFLLASFPPILGEAVSTTNGGFNAGRIRFGFGDWSVILDESTKARSIMQDLRDGGRAGLTHVGFLDSNHPRSERDVKHALLLIQYMLSFVVWRWISPLLPLGFSSQSQQVWGALYSARQSDYKAGFSWLPTRDANALAELAPRFSLKWDDETWNQSLRSSIHWYVDANLRNGGLDGGIVSCQIALELLSWAYLVNVARWSKRKFKQADAKDRIRAFLRQIGVPLGIPTSLDRVSALARKRRNGKVRWEDAVEVVVDLRNNMLHPEPKVLSKNLETSVWFEAWILATRLVELSILAVVGYTGSFVDRADQSGTFGDGVRLPWVSEG